MRRYRVRRNVRYFPGSVRLFFRFLVDGTDPKIGMTIRGCYACVGGRIRRRSYNRGGMWDALNDICHVCGGTGKEGLTPVLGGIS